MHFQRLCAICTIYWRDYLQKTERTLVYALKKVLFSSNMSMELSSRRMALQLEALSQYEPNTVCKKVFPLKSRIIQINEVFLLLKSFSVEIQVSC